MIKKLIWGWILCLLAAGPIWAQDAVVEFEGYYWVTNLSVQAKLTKDGRGTDVNLKSDLGIADQNFPYGRLTVFLNPAHRLTFTYTPISYNTNSNIKRTVEFGGDTYTINSRVVSDFKLQYFRLGWAYQFVNLDGGKYKVGTLLEVKGVQGDFSLVAPDLASPIDNAWSFYAWLPTVGIALDINPTPFLNIFAEISGLPAGQYGTIWEAEAGIKFIPFKHFSITGGYRFVDIEVHRDQDYAKVNMGGPYVGLSLWF